MRLRDRLTTAASPRAAVPIPFAVRCGCGGVVEGERADQVQWPNCPSCRQPVFVMARSGWPSAGAAIPTRKRRAARVARAPADAGAIDELTTQAAHAWRRAMIPRLVVAAVVVALAATGYFALQSRQRARFATELETTTQGGLMAFQKGDLLAALEALARADRAARGLGLRTATERYSAQLFREAQAWNDLSARHVEEFFFARSRGPREWPTRPTREEFLNEYGGRGLIVDAWLNFGETWEPAGPEQPEGATKPRETISLQWLLGGPNYQVELAAETCPLWERLPDREPRRVILGGQVAGLARDHSQENHWRIELAPATCTFLTVAEPLLRNGWSDDAELRQVLADQRRWIEEQP